MTKHATSDEQVAALGKVKFKPMQRDLLTGELVLKPPRRGNGRHIKLKTVEGERPRTLGMASWEGSGPEGKYCRDCANYGSVTIKRPDGKTIDKLEGACLQYARRTGRLPVGQKNISLCRSCDLFQQADYRAQAWLIGPDGTIDLPDEYGEFSALKKEIP